MKRKTLLRKREAKLNNFKALDLPGKFKMIKRQTVPAEAFRLWNQLPHEDRLQFIKENFKGLKVHWNWRERQGIQLSPVKIITLGHALSVAPKIGKFKFHIDLVHMKTKLNEEATLKVVQHYLPTVRAL